MADAKDAEARTRCRQQTAEDLHVVITRFANRADFTNRSTYKALITIFGQQCELSGDTVVVKTKTGGDCVQNPSDPDATFDGHKGPGHQVQIAETCVPGNDVQLITAALPQTACVSDAQAVVPMLDQLEQGARGGPRNSWSTRSTPATRTSTRRRRGAWTWSVRSPACVLEADAATLTVDDFAWDDAPARSTPAPRATGRRLCAHDAATATTRVEMPASACAECPFRQQCPIEKTR